MRILLLCSLLFALPMCSKNKKTTAEKKVTHLKVQKGTIEDKLSWSGVIRSANRVEIRTERKIKLAKVLVKNFQSVKKGQLLIEVDRSEIETKKQEAQDKIKTMTLELNSSRAKLTHADKVFNRKKALLSKGIIAEKEFDEAQREFRIAESDIKSKELDFQKLERELNELSEQLKSANYHAPMDGVASGMVSGEGESEIQAGQLLGVISDPSHLALWIMVEELYLNRVNVGSVAVVNLDSIPSETFKGRVIEVSVNASSEGNSARIKTYETGIGFESRDLPIREGYQGKATLSFQKKENVLSVPLSAVRYLDGKEQLVVASHETGNGEPRAVQIGLKTDDEAEIISGITEEEYVVVDLN